MRGIRLAAAVLAAIAVLAGVWIVGGNAIASHREREVDRASESTFGVRAVLEAKGAVASTNAVARRVEELARDMGFDVGLHEGRLFSHGGSSPDDERAEIRGYVDAQIVRDDAVVDSPPPAVAAALSSRRSSLSALEELLTSGTPPRWECDAHAWSEDKPKLNMSGHIQMQRLFVADGLACAARGDHGSAAKALEASWHLNQGLALRPEMISQMIATAVARFEAGALRKISVPAETWRTRLETMGSRTRLVEAIILEHPRPADMTARYRGLRPAGVGWWAYNLVSLLEEPRDRLAWADYGEAWMHAIAGLRDEPAFRDRAPDPKPGRSLSDIMLSISIPNIRNSFERADRLALDAELTGKILRVKEIRRAQGNWPQPSTEIAASRFPGLSWSYAVTNDAMTISLAGHLPKAPSPLVLPTSFSSRAPAP